jgi:hypothetical protein
MAPKRTEWRPALAATVLITGIAGLFKLAYDPWYLNYDTRYALLWARDLWHGFRPEYGADFAPTPHPGWTGISSLALPFGDHADTFMAWVVALAFGALVYLVYRIGEELFGRWAGVIAALVVLTRPAMQRDVMLGYLDVPFAMLIAWALLLEVRKPRRGTATLVVLAVAGLLRPEAWVLAGVYVLYLWPHLDNRGRARYVALAALGPLVWMLSDLIVTGDALHSLHGTAALATENDRRRSVGDVPYWTLQYFGFTLRAAVAGTIGVGLVFAWWKSIRRWGIPVVTSAILIAVFAVGPVFGLPLIGRYVRTPSALLAVFAGLAMTGWARLPPSRGRFWWGLVALVVAAGNLAYLPRTVEYFGGLRHRRDREAKLYGDLRSLADAPRMEAAFARCPTVTATDHRPIPYLRWWLKGNPGSVSTTEKHASPLGPLLVTPRSRPLTHRYYQKNFPAFVKPPGYRAVAHTRYWALYAAPRCLQG